MAWQALRSQIGHSPRCAFRSAQSRTRNCSPQAGSGPLFAFVNKTLLTPGPACSRSAAYGCFRVGLQTPHSPRPPSGTVTAVTRGQEEGPPRHDGLSQVLMD